MHICNTSIVVNGVAYLRSVDNVSKVFIINILKMYNLVECILFILNNLQFQLCYTARARGISIWEYMKIGQVS